MENPQRYDIDRIKCLAKQKGIKIKHICKELGLSETYLSNCKNGKDRMTDERLFKIARMLDTTYEYLTDQTDDPDPHSAAKQAESPEEKLIHTMIERAMQLSPEQIEILQEVFESKEEDFDRALSVLKAMKG